MRSIEQFRDHVLKSLPLALKHPQFFGGHAAGVEQHFRHVLSDLCFIDEREGEFDALKKTLLDGSHGVNGQFRFQELFELDYRFEVASTYAQAAYTLDYFRPSRLLAKHEIADLRQSIRSAIFER